jgi:hypothetical protein
VVTPPAWEKLPPTIRAGRFGPAPSSSKSVIVQMARYWEPAMPPPTVDHDEPFHFAMQLAGAPPAFVKKPPAYNAATCGPGPSSSNTAIDLTQESIPEPRGDQDEPSHLAM